MTDSTTGTTLETPDIGSTLRKLLDIGFAGPGPLKGSVELGEEYLGKTRYGSYDERVTAILRSHTSMTFSTGFVTGLGGLAAMPATVPAGLGAAWLVQTRMVGAIAVVGGFDLEDDEVQSFVIACMLGGAGTEVTRRAGIEFSQRAGKAGVQRVSGKSLTKINQRLGFRFITKNGTKGIVNLGRAVPLLGGVVGGTLDAGSLRIVGGRARDRFRPADEVRPAPSRAAAFVQRAGARRRGVVENESPEPVAAD